MQGLSAVGHLMSDAQYFERHNPKSLQQKRPLRATISSRLKSKLSLPPNWTNSAENSPSSLPSHFIPRAPIPPPEVLKTKLKARKSNHDDFSANNEAILKQRESDYQSPKERDGDYSYAYDCSISPAVVIKWNEEESEASENEEKTVRHKKDNNENIYEEISDIRADHHTASSSGNSSINNSDSGMNLFCFWLLRFKV